MSFIGFVVQMVQLTQWATAYLSHFVQKKKSVLTAINSFGTHCLNTVRRASPACRSKPNEQPPTKKIGGRYNQRMLSTNQDGETSKKTVGQIQDELSGDPVDTSLVQPSDEPHAHRLVDHLLIERFNNGEIRAFEILVTKYQRRVASLINKTVHNTAVTEELTQEVFLRVYRALANFRFESAFSTWLYTIARNTATTYYRDGHVHADNAVSIQALAEAGGAANDEVTSETAPSPEDDMSSQQLLIAIGQSIERLSPHMRTSIVMREMEECSYAEIANALSIPLNTVRSLIFRARATIALDIRPLLDRANSAR